MSAERIASLDSGLFSHIETGCTADDARSLLAIHNVVASRGPFSYLEIGSHLGGSLQALIADPRCTRIVSIDPRPQQIVPDDRAGGLATPYRDNSTKRMLQLLGALEGADLAKLQTVEASTEDVTPGQFAAPGFCFIDGEHTYAAALRDARFCRTVMQGAGVLVFHDFHIIERAILDFMRETARPRRGYLLLHSVFVVELGATHTLLRDPGIQGRLTPLARTMDRLRVVDTLLLAADVRRRRLLRV